MRISNNVLVGLIILVNVMWAGAFIVLKIVLTTFTPAQVLLARVILAAGVYLLLLPFYWPPKYQAGDWKWLLGVVLCEPCLLFTFETLGLANTTASQASMIVACTPLAAAGAGFLFLRERVSRRCLTGILAAVTGVVLVSFVGQAAVVGAPHPLLGNFFMLCAVCSTTAYALLVRRLTQRYSFLFLSALQVAGGTLFFLPMALRDPWPTNIPWQGWAGLAYLGLGVTFFVYFICNYALTRIKVAHAMLFANIIPVAALILAFFVLGERLLPLQYAGAVLVLGGIMYAGRPD